MVTAIYIAADTIFFFVVEVPIILYTFVSVGCHICVNATVVAYRSILQTQNILVYSNDMVGGCYFTVEGWQRVHVEWLLPVIGFVEERAGKINMQYEHGLVERHREG